MKKNKPCILLSMHADWMGNCPKCGTKGGKETYMEGLERRYAEVPQETKQKLLDLFRGGKKLGDAMKECGIEESAIGGEIIVRNIAEYLYLKKTAV